MSVEAAGSGTQAAETPAATDAPLKGKVYRSAIWTVVGYGGGSVLRVISSMILTRLLMPEAVGIMGLVNTITRGFELFTDIGVGYSIVREKGGSDPKFLNTAWTLQVIRGPMLWAAIAAAAWPLQAFYQREGLALLLVGAGFEVALSGLNSTLLQIFRRNLELHRTVQLQLATQTVNVVATVLFGLWLRSVWAYVYASWITTGFNVAVSHYLNRATPNRLCWDREAARKLIRVGPWILTSTMLTYLSTQLDRLMLGRLLPLPVFGTFMIASSIVEIPRTLLVRLVNTVLFPALCRRVDLPRPELRARLLRNRRPALLAMAAGLGLLAGCGDLIIRTLYDPRYHAAAWIFPILVLGLWPRAVSLTVDSALLALGRLQYGPLGSLARLAAIGLGVPLVARHFGLAGVVVFIATNEIYNLLPGLYGRYRHGLGTTAQDLLATAALVAVLGLVVAVRLALGLGTPFDQIPWGQPPLIAAAGPTS